MNKEFIIAGLRKQQELLKGLITQLDGKVDLEMRDFRLYDQITKQIEKDLGSLRKLNSGCRNRDFAPD
jgi:hypothetical protein